MTLKDGNWYRPRTAWQSLRTRLWQGCISAAILAAIGTLVAGCSELVLFNPKGPIGETERFIILTAFALMLLVVVPVIFMALWFAWRYRMSHRSHDYAPRWSYSHSIEIAIWVVPAFIVTSLAILIWNNTYHLDPFKPIDSPVKPVNIEVVSLDWKWLFIYPDENVAAVGELVFPAGTPLAFRLTSDTVMTSFFIPQLGSQVYAMAGMQTRLHLLADNPGTFFGHNQQFSGTGYADMTFTATAASPEEYSAWLDTVRQGRQVLDLNRYDELAKPSSGYPVSHFSSVEPGLFDRIVGKSGHHKPSGTPHDRPDQPPSRHHHPPEDSASASRGEYTLTP